jgi:hypothetical protein
MLPTRTVPCMGASQVEVGLAIPRHRAAPALAASGFAGPAFAGSKAALVGPGAQAASQVSPARQQLSDNSKKYAHTTRIAPTGGAVGPHSARDPV